MNALAALGLTLFLLDTPREAPMAYGRQLAVLRKPALWLTIVAAVLVFAVYAYAAAYLQQVAGLSVRQTGLALVVFGVGGVAPAGHARAAHGGAATCAAGRAGVVAHCAQGVALPQPRSWRDGGVEDLAD